MNSVSAKDDVMGTVPSPSTSPQALSVSELRTAMQQHLRRNGALKTLKTQLRGMVLTELMHQQKPQRSTTSSGEQNASSMDVNRFESHRNGISDAETAAEPSLSAWSACISDAVVENHLRRSRRPMSLSIFSTEAEVAPLSDTGSPADEDARLRQLLGVPPGSDYEDPDEEEASPYRKSVLQIILERVLLSDKELQHRIASHRHHCGTQTDYQADSHDETNPLTSLECRLAAVDAKYALTFSQLGHHNDKSFFTRAEVERRLQLFKSDVHEQLRAEYEQKYKLFEQSKLHDVKDAHESRYKLLVQNKTEELREVERSLVAKFEQERQRLNFTREDVERQRLDLERRQREMQSVLHERHVELTAHEAAQLELREKLRIAQLQCSKWEELSGERLMEAEGARSREQRRVEDNRRMQAEHAAELRLKEEELSRLRFRIRMLVNSASDRQQPANNEGAAVSNVPPSPAPTAAAQKVNDELYSMLVRTEELQRHAYDQQRVMQQQQQGLQERWDSAWSAPTRTVVGATEAPLAAAPMAAAAPPATASILSPKDNEQEKSMSPVAPAQSVDSAPSNSDSAPVQQAAAASPLHQQKADVSSVSSPKGPPLAAAAPVVSPQQQDAPSARASSASSASSMASDHGGKESVSATHSDTPPEASTKPNHSAMSLDKPPLSADTVIPAPLPTSASANASFSLKSASSPPNVSIDKAAGGSRIGIADTVSSHAASHDSLLMAQRSGSSSLLALAAKVLTKSKGGKGSDDDTTSSSSSSSSADSRRPAPSTGSHNDKKAPSASVSTRSLPDENAIMQQKIQALVKEEEAARDAHSNEESSAWRGIEWSAKSQYTVLESQERERKRQEGGDSDDDNRGGRLGFIDQLAAQRQQQQVEQDNVIYRDDTDDDDSILFNGNSSGSSF